MACLTALTVQSTTGVRYVEPVAPQIVRDTLAVLAEDVEFAGVKIGMLATAETVEAVAEWLTTTGIPPQRVVLDPVIRSSSGRELLAASGVQSLLQKLLPRVGWVTPNLEELAVMADLDVKNVKNRAEIEAAALHLKALAGNPALNIVVTGGHLERPDDYFLAADGVGVWVEGQRVETNATHGTGCAFSSALLSRLVLGQPGEQSVRQAKEYVTRALRDAYPVGKGKGPMNHFFAFGPA